MTIGTKSVLYGAHCFFIHPWFVAWGWWKLYGFPWDPRLWVAFFVHDLGYWGKPNMDGDEGERHPEWGARVMSRLFDREPQPRPHETVTMGPVAFVLSWIYQRRKRDWYTHHWGALTLYHSRFFAKKEGTQPSRLCFADKLAVTLEPWWFYLPRVILTDEVREYMALAGKRYTGQGKNPPTRRVWFKEMTTYCRAYAYEHADGREDTWTPEGERTAESDSGVWT